MHFHVLRELPAGLLARAPELLRAGSEDPVKLHEQRFKDIEVRISNKETAFNNSKRIKLRGSPEGSPESNHASSG